MASATRDEEHAESVVVAVAKAIGRRRSEDGKRSGDLGAAGACPPGAGRHPAALASLQRALTLAEPEGYVRIFSDEGQPMASLLRAAAKNRPGLCASTPGSRQQDRGCGARPTGFDRAFERPGTGRAQAAWNRPERSGHRSRAHRVPEHRTDPHQQDLRQARCAEQPSNSGPPGPATRPDATNPRPLTAGARSFTIRRLGHGESTSGSREGSVSRLESLLITQHLPLLFSTLTTSRSCNIITSINTCADASSSLLLPFDQATETSATAEIRRMHHRKGRHERHIDRQSQRGRMVRDPPQGAPRLPMGRLVRRAEPHPRQRRRPSFLARSSTRQLFTACSRKCATSAYRWSRSLRSTPTSPTYPPSHLDRRSAIHTRRTT